MNIDQYMRENHPELEKMIGEVKPSEDFNCPYCRISQPFSIDLNRYSITKKLIGWYQGYSPYPYAVFECLNCFEKFRHHVGFYGSKPLEDFARGIGKFLVIQNELSE